MHFRLLSSKKNSYKFLQQEEEVFKTSHNFFFFFFFLLRKMRVGVVSGASSTSQNGGPIGGGGLKKTSRTNEEGGGGGHHHHQKKTDWDETTRRFRRRRKVAALHGRGGSARSFSNFLRKMVAETEESVEWTFLDGPIDEGKMHEFTKKENGKALAWWALPANTRTYGADVLDGIEESCEKVAREGPFDCLIGFSQGATLSSVLCARKCGCDGEQKQFESVVLVSGARPGIGEEWERVQKEARFGAKKSLHVIGETDAINPKEFGFELAECFGGEEYGSEIVTHKRGHIVPIDDERIVKKIIETLTG